MYRFIRASQTGDVNCLVKGEFENLSTSQGETLKQLFDGGWNITAMTELDTGFILLALFKA